MHDKIFILRNSIQHYAWGSKTAIPELLGIPNPEGKPMAELWMGAHPKAPSQVLIQDHWVSLIDLIRSSPVPILGKKVADVFDNRLPFLFKVLASAEPLSIQVHPNKRQAEEGFKRENKLNIPLDSAARNYRDDNHKPELLCALTPFEALKGFRPVKEIVSLLSPVRPYALEGPLMELERRPDGQGMRLFFSTLMKLPNGIKEKAISDLLHRIEAHADDRREYEWVMELAKRYPNDIGVFSPLLLNLVVLEPGEAIFIPAGHLHAYLKGTGLEIMANSDNVVRGGLTPKYVDVDELLKIVSFDPAPVEKIMARSLPHGEEVYICPAKEFQLSLIKVRGVYSSPNKGAVEILLCTYGEGKFRQPGRPNVAIDVVRGKAIIVPSVSHPYEVNGELDLWKATVPLTLFS